MAQVTPEVPLPAAATSAIGVQQVPPQDAMVALPPSPPTPPTVISPTPPAVLDRATAELDWLRHVLLGAIPRLVAGRLELASGWIRSDASIRAALVQASMTCDEERQAVLEAKAARDAALGRWSTSVVAARRWRTSYKACGTSSRKRPAFAKSRKKA